MNTASGPTRALTFDESDFQWSYLALGLASLASVLFAVALPAVAWLRGEPLVARVLSPADADVAVSAADGASVTTDTLTVHLADAPAGAWLATIGLGALFTAVVWVVLYQLWRLLRAVADGSPFTQANVVRLRVMAWALMLTPVVALVLTAFYHSYLLSLALGEGSAWVLRVPNSTYVIVGFGILLALIAEVFRRGVQLEDDVEGLV